MAASTTLFFCKECLQYFLDSNAALQHTCKKDEETITAEVAVTSIEQADEITDGTEVTAESFQGTQGSPFDCEVSLNLNSNNNPNRRGWSDKETLCLITACKKHQDKFGNPGYKMKKVWEEIANDMSKQGIQVTPEHVTNKWKSLLKAYRKAKHRESRGDNRKTAFKFYEVIDKLLGSSTAVMMSLARNRITEAPSTPSGQQSSFTEDEDSDSEGNSGRKRLKRSKSMEVLLFLRDYLEEKRKDEQRRHKEIMEMEKKKVDLLTTICTNLAKN